MMRLGIIHLIPFTLMFGWAMSQIKHSKALLTLKPGRTARIDCEVDTTIALASNPLHWYRQKNGGLIERILHFPAGSDRAVRDTGFTSKFSASKRGQSSTLTISNARSEDNGNYYCACWQDTAGYYVKIFGSGTQLIVSDTTLSPPKVAVYPASERESNGKKTLLCLAWDMFPNVVRMSWEPSDDADILLQKEEKRTSSFLIVDETKLDQKNYKCKVEHERLQNPLTVDVPKQETRGRGTDTTHGKARCPQKPDGTDANKTISDNFEETRDLHFVTFSYFLMILKGTAYFCVVIVLIRKKTAP